MISTLRFWFLLGLMVLVYLAGMFVTLFENDSAQFAVMAMRMVQEHDFLNLFKGPEEYLDKPHMHYWLAALSFQIFGIHDWAYRIPGILATLLAAYSAYGLGKLLYNVQTGRLAALIFMTAQTIVLGAIDVRTDAVLTGFAIFSIWQLAKYVQTGSLVAIALGAFGAGMAFSTKGQIALVVIGFCLLCHMAYTRKWKVLFSWKVLLALFVFLLTIAPMLYAYYHQFDLHPEKVIRGRAHRSGIFFIFWEQSFERMSGEGIGKNSSDYFFFFHTFLWVFLPWTVMGILAFWNRAKAFVHLRFKYRSPNEFLTLGGIALIFLTISFAQFKLPHYLNVTMPLFAVLTASFLNQVQAYGHAARIKLFLGIQYAVLGLFFVVCCLLCFFVFDVEDVWLFTLLGILLLCIVYLVIKQGTPFAKLITLTVFASLLLNTVLNLHFYPRLLHYQAGSAMAQVVQRENIPVENVYKIGDDHTWALDFYNQHPVQLTTLANAVGKKDIWLYLSEGQLEDLRATGTDWNRQYDVDRFRITRLSAKFLNPQTRYKVLDKMYLVHLY
jgi:4-amino-4-deoxy-L-arabinose transferase-like glycosyltransferase